MTKEIRTATVIGAGIMGGGIAAQLANAGIKVHLLDNVEAGNPDRSSKAKKKLDLMRKSIDPAKDPINAAFMHPSHAARVIPGNSEDDMERALAESDLIFEVVFDREDVKKTVFDKIEKWRKPGSIVASNTSTIPLHTLLNGRSEGMKKDGIIGHWFNPPRFMQLVEVVRTPDTDPEQLEAFKKFAQRHLGKTVIECKDTPGFIANRIGGPFMLQAMLEAMKRGITVEETDALLNKPFGMAASGIFGTLDLVGLGLIPDIKKNLGSKLPATDAFVRMDSARPVEFIETMLADGRFGRLSEKGGFYRVTKNKDGSKRPKEVVDLQTGAYRKAEKPKLAAAKAGINGPRAVFATKDKYGQFAWDILRDTLLYAASLIPEVADNIEDIDAAMRAGYGWEKGPFELIDSFADRKPSAGEQAMRLMKFQGLRKQRTGVEWFVDQLKKEHIEVPPSLRMAGGRPFYRYNKEGVKQSLNFDFQTGTAEYRPLKVQEGVISLDAIRHRSKPVITHHSASTWDIGDGVLCTEFHSKANSMDSSILHVLNETVKLVNGRDKYKGMVIYNEGKNFSVGANLKLVIMRLHLGLRPFSFIGENVAPILDKQMKAFKIPEKTAKKIQTRLANAALKMDAFYHRIQNFHNKATDNTSAENAFNYVSNITYQGQSVLSALRYSKKPVVAAIHQKVLGGGAEVSLWARFRRAHAELYKGLVEAGVGLIPGWGGHARLLDHMQNAPDVMEKGPLNALNKVFRAIMDPSSAVSLSAYDAKKKMWLRPDDRISMNQNFLLADAKADVLEFANGYTPPERPVYHLPGKEMKTTWNSAVNSLYLNGSATYHDAVVADAEASLLAGGNTRIFNRVTDDELFYNERRLFDSLVRTEQTRNRIYHTANTGAPLRERTLDKPSSAERERKLRPVSHLPFKSVTGQPLEGEDAALLKAYANDTARFYWIGKMLGMK